MANDLGTLGGDLSVSSVICFSTSASDIMGWAGGVLCRVADAREVGRDWEKRFSR